MVPKGFKHKLTVALNDISHIPFHQRNKCIILQRPNSEDTTLKANRLSLIIWEP